MYGIHLCSTALMGIMYGVNGDFCSIKYKPDVPKFTILYPPLI